MLLGFVPLLRQVHLEPEVVLLLFLPALLFWESLTTSLRGIRRDHPAFPGTTPPAVMHAILTREPDLAGVPDSIRLFVLASLVKDPRARPCSEQLLNWLTANPCSR